MLKRHPQNTNLKLHYDSVWNGLPVLNHRGPLVVNYLESILKTLERAVTAYTRVSVMRFDLRFPKEWADAEPEAISRFENALIAEFYADAARKRREGRRVHPCRPRFVWVREQETSDHVHYHVAILLNRDAYFSMGRIKPADINGEADVDQPTEADDRGNMVCRIMRAWAKAIGCAPWQAVGLVEIPENAVYRLDANSPDYEQQKAEVFKRLSYFAKAESKHYGEGIRHFGCSRI